jgi:MOSC domain-containing protein YiiM
MSARVLDLVWRSREPRLHPGDNIAVDLDLSFVNLPTGTLLKAGTAILRVSDEPNDGCAKWKVRCGKDAYDWVRAKAMVHHRLRGLYCSVEKDGIVTVSDRISIA